jgi:Tol biopolymer transport system component
VYVSSGAGGQRLLEVNLDDLTTREIDLDHAAYSYPAVSPDGENIATVVTGPGGDRVVAFDRSSSAHTWTTGPLGSILDLVWTRTGVLATTGDTNATTHVLDPNTGQVTRSIPTRSVPSWPS